MTRRQLLASALGFAGMRVPKPEWAPPIKKLPEFEVVMIPAPEIPSGKFERTFDGEYKFIARHAYLRKS